jgi:hypothetical protein
VQELAQEKSEHNAAKQQLLGIFLRYLNLMYSTELKGKLAKLKIPFNEQKDISPTQQPSFTPPRNYSSLYSSILDKVSVAPPKDLHPEHSPPRTPLLSQKLPRTPTPEGLKQSHLQPTQEAEVLKMNEGLGSLVYTIDQLKSRLNFLDKQVS